MSLLSSSILFYSLFYPIPLTARFIICYVMLRQAPEASQPAYVGSSGSPGPVLCCGLSEPLHCNVSAAICRTGLKRLSL